MLSSRHKPELSPAWGWGCCMPCPQNALPKEKAEPIRSHWSLPWWCHTIPRHRHKIPGGVCAMATLSRPEGMKEMCVHVQPVPVHPPCLSKPGVRQRHAKAGKGSKEKCQNVCFSPNVLSMLPLCCPTSCSLEIPGFVFAMPAMKKGNTMVLYIYAES